MWAARGGPQRPFTVANGPVLHHEGGMMKFTVRVNVERHVRDEPARRGEVVALGTPVGAIAELDRDD